MNKIPYKIRTLVSIICFIGAFLGFFAGFYLLITQSKEVFAIVTSFMCAVLLLGSALIFMPKTKEDGTPFEAEPTPKKTPKPKRRKTPGNRYTSRSNYSFDEEEEEEDEIAAMEAVDED